MAVHFYKSSTFEEIRCQIEQHLFDYVLTIEKDMDLELRSVDQFAY